MGDRDLVVQNERRDLEALRTAPRTRLPRPHGGLRPATTTRERHPLKDTRHIPASAVRTNDNPGIDQTKPMLRAQHSDRDGAGNPAGETRFRTEFAAAPQAAITVHNSHRASFSFHPPTGAPPSSFAKNSCCSGFHSVRHTRPRFPVLLRQSGFELPAGVGAYVPGGPAACPASGRTGGYEWRLRWRGLAGIPLVPETALRSRMGPDCVVWRRPPPALVLRRSRSRLVRVAAG